MKKCFSVSLIFLFTYTVCLIRKRYDDLKLVDSNGCMKKSLLIIKSIVRSRDYEQRVNSGTGEIKLSGRHSFMFVK